MAAGGNDPDAAAGTAFFAPAGPPAGETAGAGAGAAAGGGVSSAYDYFRISDNRFKCSTEGRSKTGGKNICVSFKFIHWK